MLTKVTLLTNNILIHSCWVLSTPAELATINSNYFYIHLYFMFTPFIGNIKYHSKSQIEVNYSRVVYSLISFDILSGSSRSDRLYSRWSVLPKCQRAEAMTHLLESHLPESHLPESHLPESHLLESHLLESHLLESHQGTVCWECIEW